MKDMPKRQKILVGILAVLMLAAVYMQFTGGSSDQSVPTSSTPTNAVKSRSTTSGAGGSASGSGRSSMPVDPTQAQRPQGTEITPVGSFPGTEPPLITYNPYIQPDVTTTP